MLCLQDDEQRDAVPAKRSTTSLTGSTRSSGGAVHHSESDHASSSKHCEDDAMHSELEHPVGERCFLNFSFVLLCIKFSVIPHVGFFLRENGGFAGAA